MKYQRETWITIIMIIFIAASIAILIGIYLVAPWLSKAASHSQATRTRILHDIAMCESGGDYTAINESDSEYHPKWDVTGSYGAFQIAIPLWDEQAWRNNTGPHPLSSWAGIRPDHAPPYIQDLMAKSLFDDYHHSEHGEELLWRHQGVC